jgi:Domain of unknown function (DUF397)
MVRSSADPDSAPVTMTRDEWRVFLAKVKEGMFDRG